MTPVQAQGIPLILEGHDLIVRAKTGSGKTATFGVGLLNSINLRFFGTQALVICPTRELADQVGAEIRRLASRMPNIKLVMLCGGKPFGAQRDSLQHGASWRAVRRRLNRFVPKQGASACRRPAMWPTGTPATHWSTPPMITSAAWTCWSTTPVCRRYTKHRPALRASCSTS